MTAPSAAAGEALAPFLNHYQEVLGVLTRRAGDHESAADAVQDAYLRLLQRPAQADAADRPRAFLHRVATRVLVDHRRRERSRGADRRAALTDLPSRQACPQCLLEEQERLQQIRSAIEALPPRCQEVFRLHRFEGLGYRAIAERLGIATGTVEKHMIRALAACRRCLADDAG